MLVQHEKNKIPLEPPRALRNTSLAMAIIALGLATAEAFKHSLGYLNLRLLFTLPAHPQAFLGYLAEGFGASLIFPILHIAFSSFFRSQRTSRTRWNIVLGWSILMALFALLRLGIR